MSLYHPTEQITSATNTGGARMGSSRKEEPSVGVLALAGSVAPTWLGGGGGGR